MPVRTRRRAVREREVNGLVVFRWCLSEIPGTESLLSVPVYRSEAEARRGWAVWRRRVWARTHRFQLPHPAQAFDGLTLTGLADVLRRWNFVGPFDPTPTLRLLAEDHARLNDFEKTRGARSIPDYLGLLRTDLAAIDRCARDLAVFQGDWWRRPYPGHHLFTAARYGDGDAQAIVRNVDVD